MFTLQGTNISRKGKSFAELPWWGGMLVPRRVLIMFWYVYNPFWQVVVNGHLVSCGDLHCHHIFRIELTLFSETEVYKSGESVNYIELKVWRSSRFAAEKKNLKHWCITHIIIYIYVFKMSGPVGVETKRPSSLQLRYKSPRFFSWKQMRAAWLKSDPFERAPVTCVAQFQN